MLFDNIIQAICRNDIVKVALEARRIHDLGLIDASILGNLSDSVLTLSFATYMDEFTLLMVAVALNREDIVCILLEYGANPHKLSVAECSAAKLATSLKMESITSLLSSKTSDLNVGYYSASKYIQIIMTAFAQSEYIIRVIESAEEMTMDGTV